LLLPSMASDLLNSIFTEIVSKYAFNELVAGDLRVYLLKFADKIVQICKGSVLLSPKLLTDITKFMLTV
jgi:hypothetical protein